MGTFKEQGRLMQQPKIERQLISREEMNIISLLILIIAISIVLQTINWLTTDYSGINYLVKAPQRYLAPIMAVFWWLAKRYYYHTPRLASLTWFYTSYFIIYATLGFLINSIQYTPFSPIDTWLIQIDQMLGFSTPKVMRWAQAHPSIHELFVLAYNSLFWQILIIPSIVFYYCGQNKVIWRYFQRLLFTGLIGMLIYYFLPTVGPAHFFEVPYFSLQEHNTYLKFFEIHHKIPVLNASGGMIAMPSFHVIWALLIILVARPLKWLFYPVIMLNALLILATLFLGWHYLTDIIASFIIVGCVSLIVLVLHAG